MAIINNNILNVKFLRNAAIYASRTAALEAMEAEKSNIQDGTAILGRYSGGTAGQSDYFVKTLVGFMYAAEGTGGHKELTIFDIDGAAADVEKLRQEINAKLGEGVGSGASETVTAQLTALSGTSSDTSGVTSIGGAKAYAKDYTDEQIGNLEYAGVTTGDGKVIVNVTETDGIVSGLTAEVGGLKLTDYSKGSDSGAVATTDSINSAISKLENQIDAEEAARAAAIEALDYTDTAMTKQFVAAVDESDGVVSITRGEIESSGKTIVLTADGNDVNFEVNIDNDTLQKDENGTISVTSSALVQYEGDDDTIQIGAVSEGVRTVSSPLTIQKVTTGLSAEVKEEYHLVGHSGTTIGDPVKIYKDSHIVSITYITDSGDTHYQNLEYQYIDASGNTQTTYVDISMLVLEAEFASGVTITGHVAHGVVDPTSETFLTVGADGFKLSGVQDAINSAVDTAISGLDATVTAETSNGHVEISIEEVDGKLTAVTLTEDNIANANDLAALSGKAVTEIASSNASISATSSSTADGTVKYDLVTDASKVKMTGFTAAESGFTAITTASTVTEAVKAIETEMISNEQVTSAALNDLNTRINNLDATVSGETSDGKVNVKVTETDGVITSVDVVGTDIASASALTAEIAARKAVDGQSGQTYAANSGKAYISGATSLNDADIKLNDALKTVDDAMLTGVTAGNGIEVTTKSSKSQTISAKVNGDGGIVNDSNGLHLGTIDCGTY